MHAQIVERERERRDEARAEPARAQEAVLGAEHVRGALGRLGRTPEEERAPEVAGERGAALGAPDEADPAAEHPRHVVALPEAEACRHVTARILPRGPRKRRLGRDRRLEVAERVAVRVVPERREDHPGGEELGAGERAATPRQGPPVVRQAAPGVDRIARHDGPVPGEDSVEAQRRGDRVDRPRAVEEVVGADPRRDPGDRVSEVGVAQLSALGRGEDQHRVTRMLLPREEDEFEDVVPPRLAGRLVEDEDEARRGRGRRRRGG